MIANPVPWPNGARCAAAVTFDVDVDSMLRLAFGAQAASRAATLSWLSYDEVAIPRILGMYRDRGIRQTFFFPAWCMERHRHLVDQIVAEGHEIGLHGYMHEISLERTPGEEEELLEKSLQVAERILGSRPTGWRAPLYGFSDRSAELLVARGFLYDSTLMGDDIPYLLRTRKGELIELPIEWANDDWVHYVQCPDLGYVMQVRSPSQALEVYKAEFDAAWDHGGLWVSVWHPNVSGRLARVSAVDQMLDHIFAKGDVWIATLQEIAEHVQQVTSAGRYSARVVEVERVAD